jgi:hypothetical protein
MLNKPYKLGINPKLQTSKNYWERPLLEGEACCLKDSCE